MLLFVQLNSSTNQICPINGLQWYSWCLIWNLLSYLSLEFNNCYVRLQQESGQNWVRWSEPDQANWSPECSTPISDYCISSSMIIHYHRLSYSFQELKISRQFSRMDSGSKTVEIAPRKNWPLVSDHWSPLLRWPLAAINFFLFKKKQQFSQWRLALNRAIQLPTPINFIKLQ